MNLLKSSLTTLGIAILFSHPVYAANDPKGPCLLKGNSCSLSADILAQKLYAAKNNYYLNSLGETNIYMSNNVQLVNGTIVLTANKILPADRSKYKCPQATGGGALPNPTPAGVCEYTSGDISTNSIWSTKGINHGYLEVVASMPMNANSTGMWPAIWMMPNSSCGYAWPTAGEIDITELLGSIPTRAQATIHFNDVPGKSLSKYLSANPTYKTLTPPASYADQHQYGLEWNFTDPKNLSLSFWYDGQLLVTHPLNVTVTTPSGKVPLSPIFQNGASCGYYLIANLATGGWVKTNATTKSPQTMTIHKMQAYAIKNTTSSK